MEKGAETRIAYQRGCEEGKEEALRDRNSIFIKNKKKGGKSQLTRV